MDDERVARGGVGVSRQQYQRLEDKGNPRLDTLELIAKLLNGEIALIPKEKHSAVLVVLDADDTALVNETSPGNVNSTTLDKCRKGLADDPWEGLPGDEQSGQSAANQSSR